MPNDHVISMLSEYLDGDLAAPEIGRVELHLASCSECRAELEALRSIVDSAKNLPVAVMPTHDLWPNIAHRMETRSEDHAEVQSPGRRSAASFMPVFRAAAVLAVMIGSAGYALRAPSNGWEIRSIAGTTTIERNEVAGSAALLPGDWLETGLGSSAFVRIANIGTATVGPSSRLRILANRSAERRMELAVGSIKASVWSPPRIFVVETPSGTAVDLGCAYELGVDSTGASHLLVTSGEVLIEYRDKVSFVPARFHCVTRPGEGPGVPWSELAHPDFVAALGRFDTGTDRIAALETILDKATEDDAVSLWHLLTRVADSSVGTVYATLASHYPPPEGVTLDGVRRHDRLMLERWLNEFTTRLIPLESISGGSGVTVLP